MTASNLAGQAECSAQLAMAQTPPSFHNYMDKYHEIDEGETLAIKMKVDGSPIPTVRWFKDGDEIKEDGRVQLIAHPDGSIELRIEKVVPGDCGAYKIVAHNKNGERAVLSAVAVTRKWIYSFGRSENLIDFVFFITQLVTASLCSSSPWPTLLARMTTFLSLSARSWPSLLQKFTG